MSLTFPQLLLHYAYGTLTPSMATLLRQRLHSITDHPATPPLRRKAALELLLVMSLERAYDPTVSTLHPVVEAARSTALAQADATRGMP